MAYQAPSVDTRRMSYGPEESVQERIRRRLAERQVAEQSAPVPFERQPPAIDLSSARRDATAEIVAGGASEAPAVKPSRVPSAEEVVAEEEMKKDGGPLPPPKPKPFPVTPQEASASDHGGLRLTGPDGLAIASELPESGALPINLGDGGWKPAAAPPASRAWRPLPGERGGGNVRKALEELGAEAAAARAAAEQKAKDEAELAAEEAFNEREGLVGEDGLPNRDAIVDKYRDPNTGESPLEGVGDVAWEPAPKGTGYVARTPGQERRIGATPEERAVPLTDRRFADENGDRPPMLPGRGQSVVRGGGMSPRAPQSGIIDLIVEQNPELITATPPKDQGQFFQWRETMKQLAVAAGVNVAMYENEDDLVKAGAAIAAQYERMAAPVAGAKAGEDGKVPAKYERGVTASGAPAYIPSQAMRDQTEDAKRRTEAREFVRKFGPDEAVGMEILQAAEAGDWNRVRELKNAARAQRTAGTGQAAMDQKRLRGQTQQMMNPNIAPAMFHNSIMAQPNSQGAGRVLMSWAPNVGPYAIAQGGGMMMQGEALDAAGRQREADGQLARDIAEINAGAKKEPDGLQAYQQQIRGILNTAPDAVSAINQIRTVNTAASLGQTPLVDPKNIEYQTHAEVSLHEIQSGRGPENIATQTGLAQLHDKILGNVVWTDAETREFIRRAQSDLGVSDAYARRWLEEKRRGGR